MPGIMDALKQRAQRQFVLIKSLLEYNHIAMPTIFMGNYNMTIAHINMPSSFTKAPFLTVTISYVLSHMCEFHIK